MEKQGAGIQPSASVPQPKPNQILIEAQAVAQKYFDRQFAKCGSYYLQLDRYAGGLAEIKGLGFKRVGDKGGASGHWFPRAARKPWPRRGLPKLANSRLAGLGVFRFAGVFV